MQETRLKKIEKTNIFATLNSFKAGDSEFIPYEKSKVETRTWDVRCRVLRKQGTLEGKYRFIKQENPRGTLIYRER